ncbi:MAG TPA: hypothetical protein VGA56_13800 [Opitutaceae bacterium]
MSTRHASSPPVNRWPFILGDLLLLAVACGVVAVDKSPPGLTTIIIVCVCVLAGVGLWIAPYMMQFEAAVRLAEASARDQLEAQGRRLVQAAEQLSNAVSRSQSTEEQAGQALGTLEEVAEKLAAQADDFAQALARSSEREIAELKTQIERLARERDHRFSTLEKNIASISAALQEVHSASKDAVSTRARAFEELHARLDDVGARVDDISNSLQHPRSTAPVRSSKSEEVTHRHADKSSAKLPPSATPEPPNPAGHQVEEEPVSASDGTADAPAPAKPHGDEPKARSRHHAAQPHPQAAASQPARPADDALELPLEGMPAPRVPMKLSRRDAAGATSVVATAYIGIGNKLYVRGEGPGLDWERGVPMQFLAIGKWGWTTTDAGGPVTCRIFRNDETPMLDADVVISPGEKAEITPQF